MKILIQPESKHELELADALKDSILLTGLSAGLTEQDIRLLKNKSNSNSWGGKSELEYIQGIEKLELELAELRTELVQAEKLAALGNLIAGVAHEVNTPLGAIGASAANLSRSIPATLAQLPGFFEQLDKNSIKVFFDFIDRSSQFKSHLSSREERQYRKEVSEKLESLGIENASGIAKDLVKIGIFKDLDDFTPLFLHPQFLVILEMAHAIGKINANLDTINLAIEKAHKVIKAVKDYAHKEGTMEEKVPTEIVANIETVLTIYQNQIKHGIELNTEFDRALPAINGYPDELTQVWTNIIHNALHAMNNEGSLTITVNKKDNKIVTEITDSGPGIPPEVLPNIFERYFTTKPKGVGTGLGLSICKAIVEKHDGTIEVESQPGRTSFIISIPLQ